MTARYSIIAGAVGFLTGVLYTERGTVQRIYAANPHLPTTLDTQPMEVDPPDTILKTMQFGFPGLDTIRSRKSYVISYNRKNRVPHWVFEHLTPDSVKYDENVSRKKCEFFEDTTIHSYFRATNEDYRRSGYDRGHLVPAGNHKSSQDCLNDTFVLSNIAPQVGKGFNRDAWNNLEQHVRQRIKKYKNLYVCTGPLYLPRREPDGKKYVKYEVIGANDIAVPTHFFKVLVGERNTGQYDMEAFVMPNEVIDESVPLKAFLVPRDVIERSAGLLLFEKLPNSVFYRINGHKTQK